jgi:polar amino acid transport system substrate-binding protein
MDQGRGRKATVGVLAALAAATVLVTAGCSSSSSSSSTSPSSGASSTAPVASGADPQVAALVPAAVKSKGSITVAVDATYPPDEFVAADGKTIVGMDADLAAALGTVMGVKWNLTTASFDSIIPALQSGRYDVGLSSFTQTLEREKVVDFVTYFQAGEAFYVKAGAPATYTDKASLCGATVSVEKGTTEQDEATAQAAACAKSGKKLTVSVFGDQNAANLAVSSGRANVGYADSQVAGYIVKQSNGQFQLSGSPFEVAPYGIAFPKGSGLTKAVQAAVKVLIANGTYAQILQKWGLSSGAVTASEVTLNSATS